MRTAAFRSLRLFFLSLAVAMGAVATIAVLTVATGPAFAGNALRLEGHYTQGGLVYGWTEPGARVTLDGTAVPVSPGGRFLFGFGRDAAATAVLEIAHPGGITDRRTLAIAPRVYGVQEIEGLPPSTVTPDPALQERIAAENARVAAARQPQAAVDYWAGGFAWPVEGPISGVYGTGRILNGEPRQPHYGVDVAAPEGAAVAAPAAGIVTLAETGMVLTGGTIVIDHGQGLSSTLMHLSAVLVPAGRFVEQGTIVGKVGATGRATGPHLDWRMNWRDARLDPALLVPPMPADALASDQPATGD
ncbi:MAG: M23 family metallopeptidase [Dongiaceae bacterium]